MPITIEPSKPRMCDDERFLNLWVDTPPVAFDKIRDIPRYVAFDHCQSKLDDKSGDDHILLTKESRKLFGLCWLGWFFVYNSFPFGLSPSAYIYHTTSLGATHFIRTNGVQVWQDIEDCHVGQLRLSWGFGSHWSNLDLAKSAAFIAAFILVSCGYFIGLSMSILTPTQVIPFLGFFSHSHRQAFILPEDKKQKFASLRDCPTASKSSFSEKFTKICREGSIIFSCCSSCQTILQGSKLPHR